MRYIFLCVIIYCTYIPVYSQSALLEKGDKCMADGNFSKAASYYKKAADADPNDITAREKLAQSFVASKDYQSAEAVFGALVTKPQAKPVDRFYYAQVLRINGKYDEAGAAYSAFADASAGDTRAAEFKDFAVKIKPMLVDRNMYTITNIAENSSASDLGPTFCIYSLCFSSNRSSGSPVKHTDALSGKGYYDLYLPDADTAKVNLNGISKIKGKVNDKFDEGPATFSRDGHEMIFTRTNYNKRSQGNENTLGLYHAVYDTVKHVWGQITPLNINNYNCNLAHPSLSKDGHLLFFTSDMKGSMGETDIFSSTKSDTGWSAPVNLGPGVNTVGHEMFPFIADDGTLYFASDSRVGLGGFDIYSATNSNGRWGNVQNPGTPINSNYDDFGYVSDETGKTGYFVSNRPGGKGDDDIYRFVRKTQSVCGTVVETATGNPVENVIVKAVSANGMFAETHTGPSGKFCLELNPGETYSLQTEKDGYWAYSNYVNVASLNPAMQIQLKPKGGISLTVDVYEKESGKIKDADVVLKNISNGAIMALKTGADGTAIFDVAPNQQYELRVVKDATDANGEYEPVVKPLSTMWLKAPRTLDEEVMLVYKTKQPVAAVNEPVNETASVKKHKEKKGKSAKPELPVVYFDYNSYHLKAEARKELDKIVKLMTDNPGMEVELSSYTDARGSSRYNVVLSARRAIACVDYLAERGIDRSRLIAVGYGDKKILNECEKEVPCPEPEQAVNRRTEFKVLKMQ